MSEPLSPLTKGIIIGLKMANFSNVEVEKSLKEINKRGERSSIGKIWKKWESGQDVYDQRTNNPDRSKIFNDEEINQLVCFVQQNPHQRTQIGDNFEGNIKGCSGKTLFRYLQNEGLSQIARRNVMFISEVNKHKRVVWSKLMLRREKLEIANAIYSDETYLCLNNDKSQLVWVDKKQDTDGDLLINQVYRWPIKLLIRGAISKQGSLAIKIIDQTLNSSIYEEILEEFFIENNFIEYNFSSFQQDNAPSHSSKQIKNFFQQNGIDLMDWPSQSPDINPIENVWFLMKHKINKKINEILVIEEFKKVVKEVFMKDEKIKRCAQNSINSIPSRLNQIITKQGQII